MGRDQFRYNLSKKINHYFNKASLSFGRTSAGILWCFWGMFHNIKTTTMEYLIAELA